MAKGQQKVSSNQLWYWGLDCSRDYRTPATNMFKQGETIEAQRYDEANRPPHASARTRTQRGSTLFHSAPFGSILEPLYRKSVLQ